jgi:hypothetical protein
MNISLSYEIAPLDAPTSVSAYGRGRRADVPISDLTSEQIEELCDEFKDTFF